MKQVKKQVWSQIRVQVEDRVLNPVWRYVVFQVWRPVGERVNIQVVNHVMDQVERDLP